MTTPKPDRTTAQQLVEAVADPGSWRCWDDPDVPESVITGYAEVDGAPLVLVVSEFGFLGGSIGAAAAARITAAIHRATRAGWAVLACPASGGTRMQEGTPAFLEMVGIATAVLEHRRAGLPYLVYLRHPTTGGVFASWGSLGQLTWAQPHALIGFLGPRVGDGLRGKAFPDGVQTAENLLRHGLVDAIVPVGKLRARLRGIRALLTARGAVDDGRIPLPTRPVTVPAEPVSDARADAGAAAWAAVTATRAPDRPGLRELLAGRAAPLTDESPVCVSLADLDGVRRAVVVGQDRRAQTGGRYLGPADLRQARRGIALAAELGLPLVTVIDTPGAELSAAAEEGGLAGEIARCTAELIAAPVPTVSLLLGQGSGGAALALFPAGRRLSVADGWLAPLPPEGASLIVHRDTAHAPQEAAAQHITAAELARYGQFDEVLPPAADLAQVWAAVVRALEVGPHFRG